MKKNILKKLKLIKQKRIKEEKENIKRLKEESLMVDCLQENFCPNCGKEISENNYDYKIWFEHEYASVDFYVWCPYCKYQYTTKKGKTIIELRELFKWKEH